MNISGVGQPRQSFITQRDEPQRSQPPEPMDGQSTSDHPPSARKRGVERGSSLEHLDKKPAPSPGEGAFTVQRVGGSNNTVIAGSNNQCEVHHHYSPQPNEVSLPELKKALYKHYKPSNFFIQRISGLRASLDDCYINLAIVESHQQREKDREELKKQGSAFERLPSSERIGATNPNKLIPLEKLFEKQKLRDGSEGVPKRVLILGQAGIGKTTLSKKFVHLSQPGQGLWQERFDAVLWIPLRQLKNYGAYNLEELLQKKYFSHHKDKNLLVEQLINRTERILFILDGLDEVAPDLGNDTPLGDFLRDLLDQSQVVVTSRPAGVDRAKLKAFDLELETIGFSQENVKTYLNKVEPDSAAEIQSLIERTPAMRALANIPVQLDALCYSWPEVKKAVQQGATVTMTTLYQAMVGKLLCKDAERLNKNPAALLVSNDFSDMLEEEAYELMADEIDYLNYLSFKGLQDNLLEFESRYIDSIKSALNRARDKKLPIPLQRHLKQTSFLHTADADLVEKNKKYHFLHLTFQEFFAAKFLANHFQAYLTAEGEYRTTAKGTQKGLVLGVTELEQFVNENKYNPRYQIVWWMVAGLLEDKATLEGFFNLLEEKKTQDLIGRPHLYLIMHCLHEARARLSKPTIQRLEKVLEEALEIEAEISKKFSDPNMNSLKLLAGTHAYPEPLLLDICKKHPEYKMNILKSLGARPALSDETLQFLIKLLQDTDFFSTTDVIEILAKHISVIETLAKHTSVPPVLTFFSEWFAREQNFSIRSTIINAFTPLVATDESSRALLKEWCKQDLGSYLKEKIVLALAPQAATDESIRTFLKEWCAQAQNITVTIEIIEAFAPLVATDEVRTLFKEWCERDLGSYLKEKIVLALAPQVTTDASIRTLLKEWFAQEQERPRRLEVYEIKVKIIRGFALLIATDKSICAFVKEWFAQEQDIAIKAEIIKAFAPLATEDESIRTLVKGWFAQFSWNECMRSQYEQFAQFSQNSADPNKEHFNRVMEIQMVLRRTLGIQAVIVEVSALLATTDEPSRALVKELFLQTQDPTAKAGIANAFAPLMAKDQPIFVLVKEWLEQEQEWFTQVKYQPRLDLIKAFAPLVATDKLIYALMKKWFAQEQERSTRLEVSQIKVEIIKAFAPLVTTDKLICALMEEWLARVQSTELQVEIIKAFAPLAVTNESIRDLVKKWFAHVDNGGKTKIIEAFAPLVTNEPICALMEEWLARVQSIELQVKIIKALAPLAVANGSIRDLVKELFAQTRNTWAQTKITEAFAPLVATNESIRALVKECFAQQDKFGQVAIIHALVPLVATDEVRILVKELFAQARDIWVQTEIIETFTPLVVTEESICTFVKERFAQERDPREKAKRLKLLALLTFTNEPIRNRSSNRLAQRQELNGIRNLVETSSHYLMTSPEVLEEIGHLLDTENEDIVDEILDQHPDQAYSILPHLSFDKVQYFYKNYLFRNKSAANLYYQDKALHFYTPTGPGEPIPISKQQLETIVRAFQQVRAYQQVDEEDSESGSSSFTIEESESSSFTIEESESSSFTIEDTDLNESLDEEDMESESPSFVMENMSLGERLPPLRPVSPTSREALPSLREKFPGHFFSSKG